MKWSTSKLNQIVEADDLKVAPRRDDGMTPGTPTWIWCVAVDGELYVRAYHGRRSRWYQAAICQRFGQIVTGGATREVEFEAVGGDVNAQIDEAYCTKYHSSQYLEPMISSRAREATVKVSPRATDPDHQHEPSQL